MKTIAMPQRDTSYRLILVTVGILLVGAIISLKSYTASDFYTEPLILLYTIFVTSFELSRLIAATFYKSTHKRVLATRSATPYEPTVSFVVPCKNEEKTIAKTIDKCFAADYPPHKIDVIVINDGSTDNTREVVYAAQKKYPRLAIIDWKKNRGKRHGMAAGFKQARGEIVAQLDSDSYIDPNTFRKFIAPFENPEIGAVCAHADPENADTNLLTKMQAAYYFMSFRILKAAESTFMTVFCCSGCSSAYRKSVVLPIIDEWLNESFLGLPVTWGDDRALTNWVLRLNYKTIYSDEARAFTICPDTWKVFLKQQVRWKKGWFVNSIFASKFIYKKQPFVAFTYFFPLILVTLITPFMAARAFVVYPLTNGTLPVFYVLGVLLVASLITVYYRYVARENKYWSYIFVWASVNMVLLSFILFYALGTIQDRKWGTR